MNPFDNETAYEYNCKCSVLHEVGVNTKDYQYTYCSDCKKIKKFHWKSFWKRLKNVIIK